jgi:predicted Zn-dependent peptidase
MFKKIESIGANFNAQTDRELCGYYIDCFAKDRAFAVDLLADCALNSLLEEQHIEYQKQVVLDEKEHCSLQVWFALKENINLNSFPGQSIASTMLGSIRDIKRIKRDTLREYLDENYVGNTMCFVGTGDIRHEEIENLVSKSFAKVPSKEAKIASKPVFRASDYRKRDSDTDLCFFMFGFPFHGLQDPNFYTLSLLSKLYQLLNSATGQYNGTWFKNLSKIKSLSRNFGSSVTLDR